MKSFKKKLTAFMMTIAVVITQLVLPSQNTIAADTGSSQDEYYYNISGYALSASGRGKVLDADGAVVHSTSYCLDAKSDTPGGQNFTRVKLSSLNTLDVSFEGGSEVKTYTDNVKIRLLKLMVAQSDIKSAANALDATDIFQYYIDNNLTTYDMDTLKSHWRATVNSVIQRMVWTCVHDDSEWAAFVTDDGSVTGHKDNYVITETSSSYTLGYISDDPINDPYSYWNIFYKPMIEYIDTLPNYFDEGYDAWVYICKKNGVQSMLAGPFKEVSLDFIKWDNDESHSLSGAKLSLYDRTGTLIDEWTSTLQAHTVNGLHTNEKYTLKETVAPDGYAKMEDITFEINYYGVVNSSVLHTDTDGNILIDNEKKYIKILKIDTEGKGVSGATLCVVSEDEPDSSLGTWTTDGDEYKFHYPFVPGEIYYVKELVAPDGFIATEDVKFTVDTDFNVIPLDENNNPIPEESAPVNDEGSLLIINEETSLSILKVDIADSSEVSGALLQIIDDGGNVIYEWESDDVPYTINGLSVGVTYTLHEEIAPAGYRLTSDTTFVIEADGSITSSATIDSNGVLLIEDEKTEISVSKVDISNAEELENARIELRDEDNKVVEEWVSTTTPHKIKGLIIGNTYTLVETVAPEGYTVTSEIEFVLNEDGTITTTATVTSDGVILVEDEKTEVSISKVDVTDSKELAGAHIQILDAQGKVVEEWDSTKETHKVKGLKTGVEYTLHETVAPEGYTVTSDTTFTIAKDGTVTSSATINSDGIILVEDEKTEVSISKKDAANSEELEGALLSITGNADWEAIVEECAGDKHNVGILKDNSGNIIGIRWTSTDEAFVVKGLITGEEYVMEEIGAPVGYAYSENITFKLEESDEGLQVKVLNSTTGEYEISSVVEMFDEENVGSLVITKSIDGLNVTDEEKAGALTFTVCFEDGTYLDDDGNVCDTETKITLDKFTKNEDGTYTLTFDKVAVGTYTITETNSAIEGYELVGTSVTDTEGQVELGQVTNVELKDVYEDTSTLTGGSDYNAPKTGDRGFLPWLLILGASFTVCVTFGKKKNSFLIK